jgi:hypothetical protein
MFFEFVANSLQAARTNRRIRASERRPNLDNESLIAIVAPSPLSIACPRGLSIFGQSIAADLTLQGKGCALGLGFPNRLN